MNIIDLPNMDWPFFQENLTHVVFFWSHNQNKEDKSPPPIFPAKHLSKGSAEAGGVWGAPAGDAKVFMGMLPDLVFRGTWWKMKIFHVTQAELHKMDLLHDSLDVLTASLTPTLLSFVPWRLEKIAGHIFRQKRCMKTKTGIARTARRANRYLLFLQMEPQPSTFSISMGL